VLCAVLQLARTGYLCSGNTTKDLNSQVSCAGNGDSCANATVPAPLLSSTTVKFSGLMPNGFILQQYHQGFEKVSPCSVDGRVQTAAKHSPSDDCWRVSRNSSDP
jgi:hypothetical protein